MYPKGVKATAVKKLKKRSGARLIPEILLKELDAQQRLNSSACVFVKMKGDVRFFVIADNPPEVTCSGKFCSVVIGASSSEMGEAKDILSELGGFINDTYSPQDFYSTVALYFLSRYLKGVMEEFWSPRALAVEYMIYDPMFGILHTIMLDGNYESYAVSEVDKTFIVIGAYNMRLRKELSKEFQACLDKEDVSDKTMRELGDKLCKKYHLKVSALLRPQVVPVSVDGMQASGVPPDEDS